MDQYSGNEVSAATDARALAAWEIGSVLVSGLLAEWFVLAFFDRTRWFAAVPIALALGLMAYSHRAYRETPKQLGFRLDNFLATARVLVVPTAIAVVSILLLSWLITNSFELRPLRARFLWLPLWALFQQYALQGYINRRAQKIFGPGVSSILLVALVFAVLHLPNLVLTALTFLGGLLWAAVYQRRQNLFALALSHSIASAFVSLSFPAQFLNGLRVGFKFYG